ncbi:MAG: hypothetical protein JW774_08480, partial [Candidatus Aureabacteria bacterium]|nr:hypothetical protein [Candidatus Auribacterota bacterium]
MLKLSYISRIFSAYVLKRKSQVSFWHEYPEINEQAFQAHQGLGEYYMPFFQKALWNELDSDGIPLLNYHGKIGTQYNPIAIAQYGLGHCNLYLRSKKTFHLEAIIK